MGTRFICTTESPAHPRTKQTLVNAAETDTMITGHGDGIRASCIKNELTAHFETLEAEGASIDAFHESGSGKMRAAMQEGDIEWGSVISGQVCGLVEDIPTCAELINRVISQAEGVLSQVTKKIAG